MNSKNRILLQKIVLIAMFSALSYVGCNIRIPLPTGGMIHLGNLVVITGALLCGGFVGGLAGGIGCGLFDLIVYSSVEGMIRYFILKLIMGLVVGYLFRFFMKHKKETKTNYLLIIAGILMAICSSVIIYLFNANYIKLSSSIESNAYMIMVCLVGYASSLVLIICGILANKIEYKRIALILSISTAVIINIGLEIVARLVTGMTINGLTWEATLIKGLSTMPSCIFTGWISLYLAILIYNPLYKATKNFNFLNDIEEQDDNI